jgi:hypothetical protein
MEIWANEIDSIAIECSGADGQQADYGEWVWKTKFRDIQWWKFFLSSFSALSGGQYHSMV